MATRFDDTNPVKKPRQKTRFTLKEAEELDKCMNDPLYFIENYMYVRTNRGKELMHPFPYQKILIHTFNNYRNTIALTARQMGKTTCAAGYLLWKALFTSDQTILIVANKLEQALEIMERIRYTYEDLPHWLKAGAVEYNKGSIAFDNGSRIISRATTPDAGRGLTINVLYCDEFAFVKPKMAEEFWSAVSPTLATGGNCIITSTPNSNEDLFSQLWRGAEDCFDDNGIELNGGIGKNGFKAIKVLWNEHPERDETWASGERAKLGEEKWLREFCCEFVIHDNTLINQLKVSRMSGVDPAYITDQVRWYSRPEPNKVYLIGLDPSLGTGNDNAAIEVYQLPEMKQVAEWKSAKTPIKEQVTLLLNLLRTIRNELLKHPFQVGEPELYWTIENNTIGEAALVVIEQTGEEYFPGVFVHEPKALGSIRRSRKGLNTTTKTKMSACARLKSLIESDKMTIYSKPLVKELKGYVSSGTGFSARSGEHDDLVSATLLCVRLLDIIADWDPELTEKLRENIDIGEGEVEPMPVSIITSSY